jgi:hypothetical protein
VNGAACHPSIAASSRAIRRCQRQRGNEIGRVLAISKVNATIFGMSSDTKGRHTVAPTKPDDAQTGLIDFPRDAIQPPARDPAVFVYRAISENFEILLRVPRRRFGIVERVEKTHAVHWHLCDAVDFLWLWQTGGFGAFPRRFASVRGANNQELASVENEQRWSTRHATASFLTPV